MKISNIKMKPECIAKPHGKGCNGCLKVGSDVMITLGSAPLELLGGNNEVVGESDDPTFLDIFMSQIQAEHLYHELGKVLSRNKETW